MIRLIDNLSHTNHLRKLTPLWKCGFAAVLFTIACLSHELVQFMIVVWLLLWIVSYGGTPLKSYGLLLAASCLFFIASLPALLLEVMQTNNLTDHPAKLVLGSSFSWTVYIPESNLIRAWTLFTRITACMSCLMFVIVTTPVSELFQVMKKFGMPSLVLEIMQIMYRFLFLLTDTAEQIYAAQRARGGQIGFKRRIIDTAVLITRLFGKTMQRYTGLSYGLRARGFTDELLIAPLEPKPSMPRRYHWESAIGVIVCLIVEIWLRWRETGWTLF